MSDQDQGTQDARDVRDKTTGSGSIGDQSQQPKASDRPQQDPKAPPPDAATYTKTAAVPEPETDDAKARIEKTQAELRDIQSKVVDSAAASQKAQAEYAAMQSQAALKNAELLRLVGTPSRRPTTVVEYAAQQQKNGEPLVTCIIPKGFTHRLDDHHVIDVLAGVRKIPKKLADHWWFRANGVVAQE